MRTFTKFEKGKVFILKNFKKKMLNPAMMGEKKTNLYYFSQGREKRNQFPFWFRLLWLPQSSSSTQKSHESSEKKREKEKRRGTPGVQYTNWELIGRSKNNINWVFTVKEVQPSSRKLVSGKNQYIYEKKLPKKRKSKQKLYCSKKKPKKQTKKDENI